jgi:hypothetical protein
MLKPYPSKKSLNGKVIWQADVEVFDLKAINWRPALTPGLHRGLDDTQAKRHVAVLHVPPIDLSQAAVRAVIVHENRSQK